MYDQIIKICTCNNCRYELYVLEVRPQTAVCIIECDISLEFDAPVGYQKQEVDSPPEQVFAMFVVILVQIWGSFLDTRKHHIYQF